jgi:hypothetical protein
MKSFILVRVGLATLLGRVSASILFPHCQLHWGNTTIANSGAATRCGNGLLSTVPSTASKTVSAELSVDKTPTPPMPSNNTISANFTVDPISWYLYDIRAFSHKQQETAAWVLTSRCLDLCNRLDHH